MVMGILISCVGCLPPKDVTENLTYRGDWVTHGVYELRESLYLEREFPTAGIGVPGRDGPASVEAWEADHTSAAHILTVLYRGTQIQFVSVVRFVSIEDDAIIPFGIITNGPQAGTHVTLTGVSRQCDAGGKAIYCVNPKYLYFVGAGP